MSIMCVYQDCLSVKNPCSRIAFFRLPTDDRRDTWIRNSGNKSLLKIGKNSNRFFCEKHFRECDIAGQFNRKLLRKHAVPIEHPSLISTSEPKVFEEEESNESTMENFVKQESINFAIEAIDESNVSTSGVYSNSPVLELINASNDREELDVPYSLIELYDEPSYDEKIAEVEPAVDTSETETKLQDETLEIYFEDTCTSQVDSSEVEHDITIPEQNGTTYLHKDIETGTKNPTKKRRPNETKTTFPPSQRVKEDVTVLENSYEEDKHFALSLVGYFQRLPQSKKAMAKLKILQYLTELEIMD